MSDVEDAIAIGARTLRVLRPPDAEALIDEAAFEREEFLPYWAEPWPSGVALARAVAADPPAGKRVLELGCGGRALPSIVAALSGAATVVASDWSPAGLAYAAANARRNGARVTTLRATWTDPAPFLERGPWDLVLAADVLYERRDHRPLLALLRALGAPAWLADPGRSVAAAFWALAEAQAVAVRRQPAEPPVELARLDFAQPSSATG